MVGLSFLILSACSVQTSFALRKQSQLTFAGVPVRSALPEMHDIRDFMLFFHEGVTNAQLDAFCVDFVDCYAGHPDQGGLPYVSVYGSDEKQLEAATSKPGALTPSFVTPDRVIEDDPLENVDIGVQSSGVWGLERVRARESRFRGRGIHGYILDTGVRSTHRDFGGRAIPTLEVGGLFGRVRVCNPTDFRCARDSSGHGTHCAGTFGSSTYGVAPEALVYAMDRGRGFSDQFSSFDWLIQNANFPAVLSMSFGRQDIVDAGGPAVRRVVDAGIIVVVATGNWRSDACTFTYAWVPEVISVAASTSTDTRAGFSNWGSCVDIFAPGEDILSLDNSGDTATHTRSGTSMATPHVAGAVALLLEQNPSWTQTQVWSHLQSIAVRNVLSETHEEDPNLLLQVPM